MSKQVLDTIHLRCSYRDGYLPDAVPRAHLQQILEAGLAAPSGCNKQTTSLIAVDDPQLLDRIRQVVSPSLMDSAPALICVLTQPVIAYGNTRFNVQDYAAAIQNMLLTIKALGYESCWVEGRVTDHRGLGVKIAEILGVPEGYQLVCVLPVGKAAKPVRRAEKKAFGERAWFNGFGVE